MPAWIGFERKWQPNCSFSRICLCNGIEFDYVMVLCVVWRLIVSLDEFYVMLKVCNILYCCLLCLKHILNRIEHFDSNSIHLINTLCAIDICIRAGYDT